jgi:hypothetical protein
VAVDFLEGASGSHAILDPGARSTQGMSSRGLSTVDKVVAATAKVEFVSESTLSKSGAAVGKGFSMEGASGSHTILAPVGRSTHGRSLR